MLVLNNFCQWNTSLLSKEAAAGRDTSTPCWAAGMSGSDMESSADITNLGDEDGVPAMHVRNFLNAADVVGP